MFNLRKQFRNTSIHAKLLMMAFAVCVTGVGLCCVGFVWSDTEAFKEAKFRTISAQAKLLAFNSSAVIAFDQTHAGVELLSGLGSDDSILGASLFTIDHYVVAQWRSRRDWDPALQCDLSPSIRSGATGSGHIRHIEPVIENEEVIGYLLVVASTEDLEEQLATHFLLATVVMLLSTAGALLIAWQLQKFISRPIVRLAKTTALITQKGDFSVRVQADRSDELGTLYSVFNEMLESVESSETAFREINDQLESRVLRRTAELEDEIRQREETRQQLIDAKELAEQANLAKSQFLANISHEIRTPMNAVLGFSELLTLNKGNLSPKEQLEYVATIHNAGKHLLNLINDILDLSKIEAGKMEVALTRESPHQIIADAISVMRVPASEKHLSLNYGWSGPVPESIQTDPSRLRQLLLNLIGNAIKFTESGRISVQAELVKVKETPMLKLEVIDTGIGIPRDTIDSIFSPFVQADASTTRQYGGTGLGLTISRRISEALGGALDVSSTPGEGSVFTAIVAVGDLEGIPLFSGPTAGDIIGSDAENPEGPIPEITGGKVLLVEDGETNRRIIQLLLKRAGIEVDLAVNGKEGVEMVVANSYHAVLMDMQMPIMDGYEASRALRLLGHPLPIIALTAHAMKGDEERCRKAGCSDYLSKPISSESLIRKLALYLPTNESPATAPNSIVAQNELTPGNVSANEKANAPANTNAPAKAPATDPAAAIALQPVRSCLDYGDPEYREIINNFKREIAVKVQQMRHWADRSEFEELRMAAQWLKGTGGTAGYDHFTVPAVQLRRSVGDRNVPRITQIIDSIENLVGAIE